MRTEIFFNYFSHSLELFRCPCREVTYSLAIPEVRDLLDAARHILKVGGAQRGTLVKKLTPDPSTG